MENLNSSLFLKYPSRRPLYEDIFIILLAKMFQKLLPKNSSNVNNFLSDLTFL